MNTPGINLFKQIEYTAIPLCTALYFCDNVFHGTCISILVRLEGHVVAGNTLSTTYYTKCCNYRNIPAIPAFYGVLKIWTQACSLGLKALDIMSHLFNLFWSLIHHFSTKKFLCRLNQHLAFLKLSPRSYNNKMGKTIRRKAKHLDFLLNWEPLQYQFSQFNPAKTIPGSPFCFPEMP